MDHLHFIESSTYPIIEVPCLSLEQYDGEAFLSYPRRMGWDKSLLIQGDFTEKPLKETTAMLQTWLYFGLLHEILAIPLLSPKFLKQTPSGQIITTSNLPEYMHRWKTQFRCLSNKEQLEKLLGMDTCLKDASIILKHATRQPLLCTEFPLIEITSLSIAILGDSLDFLRWSTMGEFKIEHDQLLETEYTWPRSNLLKSRMELGGWCKSEINVFEESSSASAMYFASNISRGTSRIGKTHMRCPENHCIANETSREDYQSLHITTTCCCSPLEPPYAGIIKILNQGGIPVVRLCFTLKPGQTAAPQMNITVVDSTSVPYVAISHVWSDGLGNVLGNWLYRCQLRTLQDLVNKLWCSPEFSLWQSRDQRSFQPLETIPEKAVSFWIDTICVPLQQPLRNLAISRMEKTYREARAVLVLDSELRKQPCHRSKEEILVRISFSSWMRRLWTLQEGVLAQRLFFQMADDVVQFSALHNLTLAAIKSAHPQSLILMGCSSKLSELFLFINLENCKKIMRLWNSFRLRTTSRKGDAHIIFGTLLRLSVEELPTKWEHRMIKLLSQLPEFPQGILFAHGTRIQKKGYRWGLNFPPLSPLLDSTPAPRSQLGLTVKLPGFNLGQLRKKPDKVFTFSDKDGDRCYVLNCGVDLGQHIPWAEIRINEAQDYGLILQQHPHQLLPSLQTAVFVIINSQGTGVLYVEFICQISIGYMPDISQLPHNNRQAKRLDWNQEWCVS